MLNNKLIWYTSVILGIVIGSFYLYWWILSDVTHNRATMQGYTMNEVSGKEFVKEVEKLAASDSNYTAFREPIQGKYKKLVVVQNDTNNKNGIVINLYIKEMNVVLYFIIYKDAPNEIWLWKYRKGYNPNVKVNKDKNNEFGCIYEGKIPLKHGFFI